MPGKISFHFDDGFLTHYEQAFPIFQKAGVSGCIGLITERLGKHGMSAAQALEMQEAGWEVLCHAKNHIYMNEPISAEQAYEEIVESKKQLEAQGFRIRQFLTPMSYCHPAMHSLLQEYYDGAFTVYTDSGELPVEELVIKRPVQRLCLHRACLAAHSLEQLKAYVDYVEAHDAWLIFYDHDLGVGLNISASMLEELVHYCKEKGVEILTSSQALDREFCTTHILQEGYDGRQCLVHARTAANGAARMITGQLLDVTGSDCFECLQVNMSRDGGRTWSGFHPDEALKSVYYERGGLKLRAVPCDMTPMYHRKTGKFLVTGAIGQYRLGSNMPLDISVGRNLPYAVYNEAKGGFDQVKFVEMPDGEMYFECSSGCSQCQELENGDILIPFVFRRKAGPAHGVAAVMQCSFDGERLTVQEIGNVLDVPEEVRGIGECSITAYKGKYYLTIRADAHGYVSVSEDGLYFSEPELWRWDDGEILPTYNTQSHWMRFKDKLYLVYTRKNANNDHVFRHRAPLFAGEVDADTLSVRRSSEFVVVPERGARLGNFGVCSVDEDYALVTAAEWMQPEGCEKYGSANAVWLTEVK